MAEVIIGVVASGITIGALAAQITSSTIKLKSYWSQVQNAPEEMQDLIEDVELLSHILAEIEDDQRRNPISNLILDTTSTSRCLSYCKEGADQLIVLIDELNRDLDASTGKLRKKWASAKVVFQKEKIERYRARLERAVRRLSLSHQMYTR